MKYLIFKTDNRIITSDDCIDRIKEMEIEDITSNNIIKFKGKEYIIIYDDSFLLKHLPVNENASVLCNFYIAGNAILGKIKYTEDGDIEVEKLSDEEVSSIGNFVINFDKSKVDFTEPEPVFHLEDL